VNRRLFLRGVAGAALAAPFLSSLGWREAKAESSPGPRRLVIFYTNNGCLTNRWFPSVEDGPITAESLAGKTLAGLAPFASKLLVPRGLAMFPRGQVEVDGVTYFDPHDQGMGSKLTCAPIDPTADHWALSHSLDHEVAKLVNQGTKSPLVLSVGNSFNNVKGIISYSGAREPYSAETNPSNVYGGLTGLFGGGDPTEADYRVAQGKSIIDLVKDDLDTFKRLNMSSADQRRVDDWLSLLRETEQQVIPAACNAETATALGITDASVKEARGGGFGGFDLKTAFTLGGDMMIKLIALTMMCDNNRSIVLQWPGYVTFNWDGITHEYDHHGLSHRNGSAAVGGTCVPGVIESIHEIDLWYAKRYVQLVSLIDGVVEGEKTMLDNSAVMWLPELADGNAHNNNNLPIVIAGSAGGYLKQGVSVNLAGGTLGTGNSEVGCTADGGEVSFGTGSQGGNVPLNKLYVTLMNAVGARDGNGEPIQSFGTWDSNSGPGITNPGELTALRAS
jgi:hypothetical protein